MWKHGVWAPLRCKTRCFYNHSELHVCNTFFLAVALACFGLVVAQLIAAGAADLFKRMERHRVESPGYSFFSVDYCLLDFFGIICLPRGASWGNAEQIPHLQHCKVENLKKLKSWKLTVETTIDFNSKLFNFQLFNISNFKICNFATFQLSL